MFRTFLSLRYLKARKTNWIGMAGILVAVGALVLILSIMAGFLEESRRTLRGNLADLVIQPSFQSSVLQENGDWVPMQTDVERMLEKRDIYIRQNSEITHRASVLDKLNMNSIKLLMRGANLLADTDGKLPVQIENVGQARAHFEEKLMELDTTQAS